MTADPLAVVREALWRGRDDSALLDGRDHDPAFWDAADTALAALVERLEQAGEENEQQRQAMNLLGEDMDVLRERLEQAGPIIEAAQNLIEDVDEAMAEKLRLPDLQQKIGALYLGYGGGCNHDDDLRASLAAHQEIRREV